MATEIDQLPAMLNMTSRRAVNYLDDVLAPIGLTASNYYFILKISQRGQMTQDQLFKAIYLSHSNVTRRLAQLIKQGFVEKRRDPNDGRGWLIRLTPSGEALVPQIKRQFKQANAIMFQGLTASQQTELVAVLTQINHNLGRSNGSENLEVLS